MFPISDIPLLWLSARHVQCPTASMHVQVHGPTGRVLACDRPLGSNSCIHLDPPHALAAVERVRGSRASHTSTDWAMDASTGEITAGSVCALEGRAGARRRVSSFCHSRAWGSLTVSVHGTVVAFVASQLGPLPLSGQSASSMG